MPRKSRIDAPGALHHIIIRGIEGRAIFKDNTDRENFLERIGTLVTETKTGCYAWALMRNHVHLLLRTGIVPIATLMRRALTGYAVSFNRRHHRQGHLFQNRYKSFLCEEDPYLRELVRYIHLNPLRAGVLKDVGKLNSHPWCGHSALMGTVANDWQDTAYVLALFGKGIGAARRAYAAFVLKAAEQGRRPDLVGGGLVRSLGGWSNLKAYRDMGLRIKGDERILGSSDFVERVLKRANERLAETYRLKAAGIGMQDLLGGVCKYYQVEAQDLKSSSKVRTVTQARRALCYLAVKRLQLSCVAVARYLGIQPVTVSKAVTLGARLPEIDQLQKQILGI